MPFNRKLPVVFFILFAAQAGTAFTHTQLFGVILTFFFGMYQYAAVTLTDMQKTFDKINSLLDDNKSSRDKKIAFHLTEIVDMHIGIKR